MKKLIPIMFITTLYCSDSPTDEDIDIEQPCCRDICDQEEELRKILDFDDTDVYSDYNDIYPWNEYEERKRCAGPLWGSNKRKKNKA